MSNIDSASFLTQQRNTICNLALPHVQDANLINYAWDMCNLNMQNAVVNKNTADAISAAVNVLLNCCSTLKQQYTQPQPAYQQPVYQQQFFGQPMYQQPMAGYAQNHMFRSQPIDNSSFYGSAPQTANTTKIVPTQAPAAGMAVSQEVLNMANSPRGTSIRNKDIPTSKPTGNDSRVVNVKPVRQQKIIDTTAVPSKEPNEPVKLNKEQKLLKGLNMIDLKNNKDEVVIGVSTGDVMKKRVLADGGITLATLYRGMITSIGFRNICGLNQFVTDNFLGSKAGKWYVHAEYMQLHGLKIPYSEGSKQLNLIKDAISSEDPPKVQIDKIMDIVDTSTKMTGDAIDRFLVGLVNKYTSKGYLGFQSKYHEVRFDSMRDISSVLGSTEPRNHVGLWESKVHKDKLEDLVAKILCKAMRMHVYNMNSTEDVPSIMTSIGSYTADNGFIIKSIEDDLINKNIAVENKRASGVKELKANPCYQELQKYVVVGINEVGVISNCSMDVFYEEDEDIISISPLEIEFSNAAESSFEKLFINYSANSVFSDLLIYPKPYVSVKYMTFMDEGTIKLVL